MQLPYVHYQYAVFMRICLLWLEGQQHISLLVIIYVSTCTAVLDVTKQFALLIILSLKTGTGSLWS
jgi:hypothetical protein